MFLIDERAIVETARYGRTLSEFERGWVEGLTAYAWWRDGTEYVGTCGTTKAVAIDRFIHDRKGLTRPPTITP